jgi:hypothetical protein
VQAFIFIQIAKVINFHQDKGFVDKLGEAVKLFLAFCLLF